MEEWQKQRLDFYQNSNALDFIENYFDVKKGVRCIACHEKDMYVLKHEPTYRLYDGKDKCRAYTLPDSISKDYSALIYYACVHSYVYTFDKCILEWNDIKNKKSIFIKNRVGLNTCIELDAPIDINSDKIKRLSFFDHIEQFNEAIEKIINKIKNICEDAKKITEIDYKIDYNLQFSGNGIYIHIEGYYEEDLLEPNAFKDNMINLIDILKEKEDLGDDIKVHVCNNKIPWNKYFKIPFTFHESRPRISIPLPKGKLDEKWIDEHSNVNNIMNDYSLIKEIINNAGWNKIW